jgi:CxxC motif-containing protein
MSAPAGRPERADERVSYLCIGCPLGCRLEVEVRDRDIVEVRGSSCKKGVAFGRSEHTHPERVATTTVAVTGAAWPRLPVKTLAPVPKALVRDVCAALHEIVVAAPVGVGDVVLADVCGTGVDVVATRTMLAVDR